MHKKEETRSRKNKWDPLDLVIGPVVSLGVCILFLTAASLGISAGWLSEDLMDRSTIAACIVGPFSGSLIASRRNTDSNTAVTGLLNGAVMFLLLYLIGTLIYGTPTLNKESFLLLFACLCGGALSGALGRGAKKSRAGERPRKRRKR